MSIQQNLARCFKSLQKIENISVTLIDDHIDKWDLTYMYPSNKEVTLRFDFHLKELLPPKITVVFPASIQYVCFQELGSVEWKKNNNDILTLIYALQTEFSYRAQTRTEGRVQTAQEAQSQWKFVQGAHTDWGYVDVVELSNKFENGELDNLRDEGTKVFKEELGDSFVPQKKEQVAENKVQVAENKEKVAEIKEPQQPVPVPENKGAVVDDQDEPVDVFFRLFDDPDADIQELVEKVAEIKQQQQPPPVPGVPEKEDHEILLDFFRIFDDQDQQQPPLLEKDEDPFDFLFFDEVEEIKEKVVKKVAEKVAEKVVLIEEQEDFVDFGGLFDDDLEQAVLPENQEECKEMVPEKKEILKMEEPVQENNQDLQENKEEIITN
jgi:hypothetical protein